MMTTRTKIISFITVIVVLLVGINYFMSRDRVWYETVEISSDLKIKDTIEYHLETAILLADKSDLIIMLKDFSDSYIELMGEQEGEIEVTPERQLLILLDTLKEKYVFYENSTYTMKLDTISKADAKVYDHQKKINQGDWQSDTIVSDKDYKDVRWRFKDSMNGAFREFIKQGKATIINKESGEKVKSIFLKCHSFRWSFMSHYEFKNGDFILTDEAIFGL